jgi:hypothetical protein
VVGLTFPELRRRVDCRRQGKLNASTAWQQEQAWLVPD